MGKREERKLLMKEGQKHLRPLKHSEFKCPVCGGVASIAYKNTILTAECHACSLKSWRE